MHPTAAASFATGRAARRLIVARLAVIALAPSSSLAQTPADTVKPQPAQSPSSVPVDFSGVLFANYQYRGDAGTSKSFNKFDVERVYLTFRIPAGQHLTIRVTADVFQQSAAPNDAFYKGWVLRAKYAYLQYDLARTSGWSAQFRGGLLQNVVIDHVESFWPRWIALSPIERAGFFASADAGVAALVSFPSKLGEAYLTVVNGPGYTSRETDRFKDYAGRITLTPFANSDRTVLKTFTVTAWGYVGAVASSFASGGPGQVGPVGSGLPRTRAGLFLGLKDPRFATGLEIDGRKDGAEVGANTPGSPRSEIDSAGRLAAGFAVIKPFQLLNPTSRVPLGVVARVDRFTPNAGTTGYVRTVIAGFTWDLSKQAAISLDYQEQTAHDGAVAPDPKTYFMHVVASF